MAVLPRITSVQNPRIKSLLLLEKARERKRYKKFVVEGQKEIVMALEGDYFFEEIFFCPEIISLEKVEQMLKKDSPIIPVGIEVFEKIAYRKTTGGLLGVARQKEHPLEGIRLRENPLILIVEAVEKPGNLGALLRTADACAVDGVILCDPQTDFYNPNVVRSSLGCVFTVPLAISSREEILSWLKKLNIAVFSAHLMAEKLYYDVDFKGPSALVLGTEATGLTTIWSEPPNQRILIPMEGKIDSLNVSIAAAILLFEAKRQRA